MKLQEKIQEDIKQAMREKEVQTLEVLRMLSASLKNKAIELQKDLEDAEVIAVIRSDVKKLAEAIKDFTAGAREDLVEKTEKEIDILKSYLPPEMSKEDLEARVEKILGEKLTDDVKDVGKAMGVVMQDLRGLVDGNRVREAVQSVFSKQSEDQSEE